MDCRALLVVLLSLGCSSEPQSEPEPACVSLPDSCAPLYQPSFDQIYQRTLSSTCAQTGGACHGDNAGSGQMLLVGPDHAYSELLGLDDGRVRVVPGDPSCSRVMVKLESAGTEWSMPPGKQLSAAERCVFQLWISAGAER